MATKRKAISKTVVNFWLDSLLLILFVTLCWASVILHFVFPRGPEAAGWVLWGWTYVEWANLQFGLLATFSLGILVHLMLHWPWICGVIATHYSRRTGTAKKRDDGSWTLYGVGTLIVLFNVLGVGVAMAALAIQGPLP